MKIFTDETHAPLDHRLHFLVHPVRAFWGDGTAKWEEYKKGFEFYRQIFTLVSDIESADICVLPMNWNYYVQHQRLYQAEALANLARAAGKKIFIWVDGDRGIRPPFVNAVVLQNAAFRSMKRSNQFIRPGDARDLVDLYCKGTVPIRKKGRHPKVGFCGQANSERVALIAAHNLWTQVAFALHFTDYEPIRPTLPHIILRKKVLSYLAQDPHIEHEFIIREKSTTRNSHNEQWRQQFVDNMRETDYTVCVRGTANYSIRFYETLAMGRIPIFVDTDCALPFEDAINWKSYCIWVEQSELKHITEKVLDFHNTISEADFQELQIACRRLWVDRLSPEGFHRHFFEYVATSRSL